MQKYYETWKCMFLRARASEVMFLFCLYIWGYCPPPPPITKSWLRYWSYPSFNYIIKGEIWKRFNVISEERVAIFLTQQWKLDENQLKNKEVTWHFEDSQIFKKYFLTSRYEYANEWVDVIALHFIIHFVHRNDKNFIFQLFFRPALIPLWIDAE